ncbi:glycoside hydrolase family 3 N-terminal domain-containing protein [Calidifontibacter terrae]
MVKGALVAGTVVAVMGGAGVIVAPAQATPAAVPSVTTCTATRMASVMPIERKIGQLFMVGNPATGASSTVKSYIAKYHIGNVFLSGRSTGGVSQVASVTASLRSAVNPSSTQNVKLLISTDQEGGYVQVLKGSGFSTIPTGLTQGTYSTGTLYSYAQTWGRQMRAAGVNMNLAPVADTVPASLGRGNPPIGYWYREYNYYSALVAGSSSAFMRGMKSVGVAPTAKHFPGLGAVRANTDTTVNVHDYGTTSNNPYLTPFKQSVNDGVPFVMMSSAIYDRIDGSRPAVFSPTVVGLLRNMGYKGIVMTDDLGVAKAMSPWSYGMRAINTINAGGQLILTVTPAAIPEMYSAVLGYYGRNATFRARVNAATLAMLQSKQAQGLLPATC